MPAPNNDYDALTSRMKGLANQISRFNLDLRAPQLKDALRKRVEEGGTLDDEPFIGDVLKEQVEDISISNPEMEERLSRRFPEVLPEQRVDVFVNTIINALKEDGWFGGVYSPPTEFIGRPRETVASAEEVFQREETRTTIPSTPPPADTSVHQRVHTASYTEERSGPTMRERFSRHAETIRGGMRNIRTRVAERTIRREREDDEDYPENRRRLLGTILVLAALALAVYLILTPPPGPLYGVGAVVSGVLLALGIILLAAAVASIKLIAAVAGIILAVVVLGLKYTPLNPFSPAPASVFTVLKGQKPAQNVEANQPATQGQVAGLGAKLDSFIGESRKELGSVRQEVSQLTDRVSRIEKGAVRPARTSVPQARTRPTSTRTSTRTTTAARRNITPGGLQPGTTVIRDLSTRQTRIIIETPGKTRVIIQ